MTLENRVIVAIIVTLVVLWLWNKACQRFWRWWRSLPRSAYRGPGYQPHQPARGDTIPPDE